MPDYYIGVMSGTSLDGIDAVLADFGATPFTLLHACYEPYPSDLRKRLAALHAPERNELHCAALAANALARAYAGIAARLLKEAQCRAGEVVALGCHGQTVRHRPQDGYTIQLVNGALLAELTRITVVCDFRNRDIAAGGEGAPLVPAFHHALFHDPRQHRVIVNIGGIANLTNLPRVGDVTGFDCGPGNVLLDAWIADQRGETRDADGAWAASGRVIASLLEALAAHEFFSRPPPRSTGRETFNLAWVRRFLGGSEAPADVQATLTELTAGAIAHAVREHCIGAEQVFVCGGGARNRALVERIRSLLGGVMLDTTDALGVDPARVEALAFAWLARRTITGLPGNLPAVTGARGPRILGAIYPA